MAIGRQGRLEPRAGPAFQPTCLSGPGLCAAVLGPQMGNNRAVYAGEQKGAKVEGVPQKGLLAWRPRGLRRNLIQTPAPSTAGADGGAAQLGCCDRIPRLPSRSHFPGHKMVTLLSRVTQAQSLLRGASARGRCSRHTTLTGSAVWSSARRPPMSPV